jgi:hypothetical protein
LQIVNGQIDIREKLVRFFEKVSFAVFLIDDAFVNLMLPLASNAIRDETHFARSFWM